MDEQCSTMFNTFITTQNLIMNQIIEIKDNEKNIQTNLNKISNSIELRNEELSDIYEKLDELKNGLVKE